MYEAIVSTKNESRQDARIDLPTKERGNTMDYRALKNYVRDVIDDHAEKKLGYYVLDINCLPTEIQGQMAVNFLKHDMYDTQSCWDDGETSEDSPINHALFAVLSNPSEQNKAHLADLIRANAIKRYHADMQEMVNEICEEKIDNEMEYAGLAKVQDNVTGEYVWEGRAQ